MYTYRATIFSHRTSTSSIVLLDLGFGISHTLVMYWLGIKAPKCHTKAARAALTAVQELLPAGSQCQITTSTKRGKDRKYFGHFMIGELDLNLWQIANKYATRA